MITGDRNIFDVNTEARARLGLQRGVVEKLTPVFWGKGSLLPKISNDIFDVITVQDPFWRGLFALYVARQRNIRLNVQVHADLSAQTFLRRVIAKIVLRHADSVRVVSKKIREQVLSISTKVPVYVLPVFIDIQRFREVTPVLHTQKTILWIGRFEDEKNPKAAIDLLESVQKTGLDVALVLLGAGSKKESLRERAHNLKNVSFEGWQDPLRYLAHADVVLCTSKHESWGASIIEALAAGVPVVAPDVGIAKEAGAFVVPRENLTSEVIRVLHSGVRGELNAEVLPYTSAEEWANKWKETL
ncbi:MAG: glycosyltransferase [Candidatus Paceibacterota bacterium]